MKLTFEEKTKQQQTIEPVNTQQIRNILLRIDSMNLPFVILENANGDYMQAAGNKGKMAIECRFYFEGKFKHFVLGYKDSSKIWDLIESRVGPIRVLAHEALNLDDAVTLFTYFFEYSEVSPAYNKRNVTKQVI